MTAYLTVADVLAVAEEIGVDPVPRDVGLLDAAVNRPRAAAFGREAYPDLWEKAAALMHSIIGNHPFVDGNKRVGLVAALAMLHVNAVAVDPFDEAAAYDLTVAVAAGELSDVALIADALRRVFG